MISAIVMRRFVEELEEIVNGCDELQPEERLAELLVSVGLFEKSQDGYRLTEAGKKFLKMSES